MSEHIFCYSGDSINENDCMQPLIHIDGKMLSKSLLSLSGSKMGHSVHADFECWMEIPLISQDKNLTCSISVGYQFCKGFLNEVAEHSSLCVKTFVINGN